MVTVAVVVTVVEVEEVATVFGLFVRDFVLHEVVVVFAARAAGTNKYQSSVDGRILRYLAFEYAT